MFNYLWGSKAVKLWKISLQFIYVNETPLKTKYSSSSFILLHAIKARVIIFFTFSQFLWLYIYCLPCRDKSSIGPTLCSPEPKAHWWAYRIGRPPSTDVRRRPSPSTLFKHLFRNHWANQSRISNGASMGWENENCSNGPCHMAKMAAMPI